MRLLILGALGALLGTTGQAMGDVLQTDWRLHELVTLLDARDFTAYEATDPLPALKAQAAGVVGARKRNQEVCSQRCEQLRKQMYLEVEGDCDCGGYCRGLCDIEFQKSLDNVANRHTYVEGGLASPTALYETRLTGYSGRMDDYVERRETLIVYQEGRAAVVVSRTRFDKGAGEPLLAIHVLRWERGLNGGERLGEITSFVAHGESERDDIKPQLEVWRFTAA